MKRNAKFLGLIMIVVGLALTAVWAVLYADLCPNDPECHRLNLIDLRFIAVIVVGCALYFWSRRQD